MAKFHKVDLHILSRLYQNSNCLFTELDELILKFIWNCKGTRIAQKKSQKKNRTEGLKLLNLKAYYKVIVIEIVWDLPKEKFTVKRLESRIQK